MNEYFDTALYIIEQKCDELGLNIENSQKYHEVCEILTAMDCGEDVLYSQFSKVSEFVYEWLNLLNLSPADVAQCKSILPPLQRFYILSKDTGEILEVMSRTIARAFSIVAEYYEGSGSFIVSDRPFDR